MPFVMYTVDCKNPDKCPAKIAAENDDVPVEFCVYSGDVVVLEHTPSPCDIYRQYKIDDIVKICKACANNGNQRL